MENRKFDDFVKAAVEAGKFEMNEKDWLKFEAMLDDEPTKKRIIPFWFRGLMSLLLLAIGTFVISKVVLNHHKNETTSQKNTAQNNSNTQNTNATKNNNTSHVEANKKDVSHNNDLQNSALNNSTKPLAASTSNTASNTVTTTLNNDNNTNNKTDKVISIKKHNQNNAEKNIKGNKKAKQSNYENNAVTNTIIEPNSIEIATAKQEKLAQINAEKKTLKEVEKIAKKERIRLAKEQKLLTQKAEKEKKEAEKLLAIETIKAAEKRLLQEAAVKKITEKNNKLLEENTYVNKGKIIRIDTYAIVKPSAPNYTLDGIDTIFHPRYVAHPVFVPQSKKKHIKMIAPKEVIVKTETKKETKQKKVFDENFEPQIWVLLHGGSNGNIGFSGNKTNPSSFGLSHYFSTGVYATFSDRWSANGQFGFTYVNALNTQKTVNYIDYSFGRRQQQLTATYKYFTQLYLPINVQYQFAKNQFLSVGLGASFLLDVRTNILDGTSNTNTFGYRTGFNKWDIFGQVGYAYQLNHRTQAVFNYSYGFMDATKNIYFNNSIFDKQQKLSIGIKYNLKQIK